MGLTCCTQRESQSSYLEQVQREMDMRIQTQVRIKPLVNMIPETQKRTFKQTPQKTIRQSKTQGQIQDKFDLKVELLLERLKADLNVLRNSHAGGPSNPEFQKQLLIVIGAHTKEISKLVVQLYQMRRMQALDRLSNTSCRVGPKMDQSISGASRSRKDETMNDLARNSSSIRKNLAKNGGFATEKAWIDARLAYRRIVFKMIKDIESHCDDVICLTQNFLQLSREQFESLCDQEQVDLIIQQTDAEVQQKQISLRRSILSEAAGSDSSDEDSESVVYNEDESSGLTQDCIATQFNSIQSPSKTNLRGSDEEEKKEASPSVSSYRSDFSSIVRQPNLDKPTCLKILQQIIAVKREQAFCQSADKEIFMTNDKHGSKSSLSMSSSPSTPSESSQANQADQTACTLSQASKMTTEEEVFLMNIDYFEQWDRIHQKFNAQEKDVLQSMKTHGIRML